MPKLGEYEWLLDTAFFLYPTVDDAKRGTKAGGTGFLIAIPSERWPDDYHHVYGVTNWHVVESDSRVIRINRKSAAPAAFERTPSDWHFVPGPHGYDVAVTPLALSPDEHRVAALGPTFFLTDDDVVKHEINAGEDVFMLGRFVDYDGIEVNEPSLRFGNISIMRAPIEQPNGCQRTSFVLDMHSRTGYSGSPVFVYRTTGSIFAKPNTIMGGGHLLKLLGVHWGQFPERWEFADARDSSSITKGKYVTGFSGMTCVCPAVAIREVLELPELRRMRSQIESQRLAQLGVHLGSSPAVSR